MGGARSAPHQSSAPPARTRSHGGWLSELHRREAAEPDVVTFLRSL